MLNRKWWRSDTITAFGVLLVCLFAYPVLFPGRFGIALGVSVGIISIAAVGLVLLLGYAQQLAVGQAAFCIIGGYGTAILCARFSWDPLLAMFLAAGIAMLIAWILGRPILRLQGYYLAMASLAFQLILVFSSLNLVSVTGGAVGISGIPIFSIAGVGFGSELSLYVVSWIFAILALLLGTGIGNSRVGRALRAMGSSEIGAASVGINLAEYKTQMFVLSGGLASISGSLMVHYLRVMEPNLFGFQFSLMIITAAVLGGLQSVWGGVLGATLIVVMKEALHGVGLPLLEVIIMGALTVAALILAPNGLAGAFSKFRQVRHGTSKKAEPSSGTFSYSVSAAEGSDRELLEIRNVSKSFGSLAAVSEVSFEVGARSITALIGPNGAGKTTVFNLIAGSLSIDAGEIAFQGQRINELDASGLAALGIARTFQQVQLFEHLNIRENVMCGRHRLARIAVFDIAFRPWRKSDEEYAIRRASDAALEFVGLGSVAELSPQQLSFGQQRKLEIARALASEPTLLLMDEPASGLNDSETEELANLIARIRAFGTTVLLVEHDMRLVMGLSDHIVVMHHGRMLAQGDARCIRADQEVISAYLGSA